ncbi:helix-turn-helix domain-containing protein [Sphingomonas sp. Leaf21]|uniref:helix-turn-helix domain-containing protein n=1 Tax=Sphingomonas sp. Leaf21 TaxID=2876550 RepID=UPI001E45D578|nr:helix-turn-helix transcriptional regulator [Sphingomonas sp. Leaf21]
MKHAAALLSERQKECLRLVGQGLRSKEIGPILGLAPGSVDTYIKAAVARLGVSDRRVAARILAEFELSQRLGSPPEPLPPTAELAADGFQQEPQGFWKQALTLPPIGGHSNDLSVRERLLATLRVACVMTGVAAGFILLFVGALRALS